MFDKTKVKVRGKTFETGHDKEGRMIKVTMVDGVEVSRRFTGRRILFPGALCTANLGIKKFKHEHPDATHEEIQQFKNGTWAYPPAQMHIEATAMKEDKKHGKAKR